MRRPPGPDPRPKNSHAQWSSFRGAGQRSLKQLSFDAASGILSQTVKPSPSAAKTGDTVMSENPNKTKMNAMDVILNVCNIESSVNKNDYS
jgi:hypothetical protein